MSREEILQCPVLVFVRLVYAAVILIKLSISANIPSSQLGKINRSESNKIDNHLEQLLTHLRVVALFEDGSKHVLSSKFLGILKKLKRWYEQQKQSSSEEVFCNNDKAAPENKCTGNFAAQPVLGTANTAGMIYQQATGSNPWPGPSLPQQRSLPAYQYGTPTQPNFQFPNTHNNNYANIPAVDQSGTQSIPTTSWSTTNYPQFPETQAPQQAAPFQQQFPIQTDPNLFTHLANVELEQGSQDNNWMFDVESFNALDFANLPDFNWASWPQQ